MLCTLLYNTVIFLFFIFSKESSLYHIDHIYPSSTSSANVILYGEIGTSDFNEMYKILRKKADKGELSFAVRHFVHVSLSFFFLFTNPLM